MPSLRAQQLLLQAARLEQLRSEKVSPEEIKKKIRQIKYLASKKASPSTLQKEMSHLENLLRGIFALEKKLKSRESQTKSQIDSLQSQLQELKKQLAHTKDLSLRRKINKISFLLSELVAKSEIKKEVKVQEALQKLVKLPPSPAQVLSLQKIDELQARILALKRSGKYPPEKIARLEQKLTELEKRLPFSTVFEPEEESRHLLLFGPEPLSEEALEAALPPPPEKKISKVSLSAPPKRK